MPPAPSTEIIFEVTKDQVDGGYSASAIGFGIVTEGQTLKELRYNVMEAIDCHFDDIAERPTVVHLHFVRDEVISV